MASNPPGACCLKRTLHEGDLIGTTVDIFGLPVYQVGKEHGNDRILVILTDIYGFDFKNTRLLADQFSRSGYHVLVPDILKGNPATPGIDLPEWLKSHTAEITSPITEGFVSKVKTELKPKSLVGIGYCFGAKYLVQLIGKDAIFDAGAIAHPSFVTIEEVEAITKPILISAAEIDPIFTVELRHETEKVLVEGKKTFQIDLFSGVSHGFTSRGDISIPQVKYAKEKAFKDQVEWFNQY